MLEMRALTALEVVIIRIAMIDDVRLRDNNSHSFFSDMDRDDYFINEIYSSTVNGKQANI